MQNFTTQAQLALKRSRQEAQRLRHGSIGTEHLLLAILEEDHPATLDTLWQLGIDPKDLRRDLDLAMASAAVRKTIADKDTIAFEPSVKMALALAGRESRVLQLSHVGIEHIILGILEEGQSLAARVLGELGLEIETVRTEAAKIPKPEEPARASMIQFTAEAQQVLRLARLESNREYVGIEHLMLGLIALEAEDASPVLQAMDVDLEMLRLEVEKELTPREKPIPFSPRARTVLSRARSVAKTLKQGPAGPEHILLAIIRQREGGVFRALTQLGVDLDKLAEALDAELRPDDPPPEA